MIKSVSAVLVLAWVSSASVWAADQTMSGVISDSLCGASHRSMTKPMTDRECTQSCAAQGAIYVLTADGKIYKLTNHSTDLKAHAGHTVNITGELKGDTIRVSKVEMPRDAKE